jgi:RNA polymerase sigma-70 factor (ECF subfamily)
MPPRFGETKSPPANTADALRRLAIGPDEGAWTTVLHLHGGEILRATHRILGDPMSAEDACQETLLQIRDRAGQFRGRTDDADATARNWIMRIACNTALHMLRQRSRAKKREQNVARQAPVAHDPLGPADAEHRNDLAERVRVELSELPEKQRLPLVLHFYAGLNYDQISRELRCGVGAARVRVHRALEKLRRRLATMGVILTAAAIYTLLSAAPASAAEFVMDPERLARWHNLLFSSQHATINVVGDPRFHALAKVGYAAASAAICGTLAWSSIGKPEKIGTSQPSTIPAPPPKVSIEREPATETRTEAKRVRESSMPSAPAYTVTERKIARTESSAERTVSKSSARAAKMAPEKAEQPSLPVEDSLVSIAAQLELLRGMQHELNQRVTRIHQTVEARDGVMTEQEQAMLHRAAGEQGEISNLLRTIADQIKFENPREIKQAKK